MSYKTVSEIKKALTSNARWWHETHPDPRFELGAIYTVKLPNREGSNKSYTGQIVYSVKKHFVKLRSEDGNSDLHIYPNEEVEYTKCTD